MQSSRRGSQTEIAAGGLALTDCVKCVSRFDHVHLGAVETQNEEKGVSGWYVSLVAGQCRGDLQSFQVFS